MMYEVTIGVVGVILSFVSFIVGQKSGAKLDGQKQGELFTELKNIKEDVKELKDDIKYLNVESLRSDIDNLKDRVDRQGDSIKRCHQRIDEHLKGEHLMKVVDEYAENK